MKPCQVNNFHPTNPRYDIIHPNGKYFSYCEECSTWILVKGGYNPNRKTMRGRK